MNEKVDSSENHDELFLLIHSLTPSEKRYFKLFAQRHTKRNDQNYIRLFDALERQLVYDPDKIIRKFKGERFIEYLPQERKYLFDQILESMRQYTSERKDKFIEIVHLIQDHQFLIQKGLYTRGIKILHKAKKIAYQYDQFHLLKELLIRERKIMFGRKERNLSKAISDINKEIVEANEKLVNLSEYSEANYEVLLTYRQEGDQKNGAIGDSLKQIMDAPMFTTPARAYSFLARHYFWLAKANYFRLCKQPKDSRNHYESLIQHWESRKDRIRDSPTPYKLVLSNYLNIIHLTGNYQGFDETIKKINALPEDSFDDEAETFQNIAHLTLLKNLNLPDLESGLRDAPEIEEGMKKYETKITPSRRLSMHYNLMQLFFLSGNFSSANRMYNNLQIDYARGIREDIRIAAEIIRIMIQLELKNPDLASAIAVNMRRKLKSGNRLGEFEKTVLKYLKAISDQFDQDTTIKKLKKMKQELENKFLLHEKSTLDKKSSPLGFYEVLLWVKNKLTQKPMDTLMKELKKTG